MMAENVVYTRGTRQGVREVIAASVSEAVGGSSEDAQALLVRMGLVALMKIKQAFVEKSKGGTDEAGESWPKLAKSTVAYSRRHPGVPKSKQRAAFAPSWMLTKKQRKRWWELYRSFLGKAPQGAAYHQRGAQVGSGWAAARAWKILKDEGAQTLMMKYGDEQLYILRSTGALMNSISPGIDPSETRPPVPPPKPQGEGGENQVFRLGYGSVIIGTNRKHALTHHEGTARIPQRRLWPEPSKWPQEWWDQIIEQGKLGLLEIIQSKLQGAT